MQQLGEDLFCHADTCNVYVVRRGIEALLIDFGSGSVLDELPGLGIKRVEAVWLTHHHRDQAEGLARAVEAGIPIFVPHAEQDLFHAVDAHWQARDLDNTYNNRQDRFSLLDSVPIAGTLRDYATLFGGGRCYTIVPTPGHTVGSLSILGELEGRCVAFTGDLIAAGGKVPSLAALQWSYSDAHGAAASMASLLELRDRVPAWLLPAHGVPIFEPGPAIDLLVNRLRELLDRRGENLRLQQLRAQPYQVVTRHVLWNRTSLAYSYVLLAASGKALLIDFGYDFMTGLAAGSDRASRRPWLYTLCALKRDFGVHKIDVVMPTHYHDDHVAGCNLLREVEGTEVWAAANFADVLAQPRHYDLSCLWYDPIPVQRVLALGQPVTWEEYQLTPYALPGHTQYAVALAFEADGKRFLATGDQYQGSEGQGWNYVYRNGFGPGDYRAGAELYRRLAPEIILSGHWEPRHVAPGFLARLAERDATLERLHRELLPTVEEDPAQRLDVRTYPYQATLTGGETGEFTVQISNLADLGVTCETALTAPEGWQVTPSQRALRLAGRTTGSIEFRVTPPRGLVTRRARIAVDLSLEGRRLGQLAEALVTVVTHQGA